MEAFYRPTWVEISLDALKHNWNEFRKAIPKNIRMMAVVKANAYGHGAVEIAREALALGADYLGVAFLDEALSLRRAGIDAPILVLGYTSQDGLPLALEHRITLTVFSPEILAAIKGMQPSADGKRLKIHIKIDSGMGRLGLHQEQDAIPFIEQALALPNVDVEGLFTHYATADKADKSYMQAQYCKFKRIADHFADQIPIVHAGNSATAIDAPELACNMVRLGVSMYGLYPSEEVIKERIELKPVFSLKTRIVHLKRLPAGEGISYGLLYQTQGDEWIATLPIGYADGFSRMLNGIGDALVGGKRVPVVGSICMDQCMIRVSGEERLGDEVVLIGRQGDMEISADELAKKLGTINYEIPCMISHRVPRVYVKNGKVIKILNPLTMTS